MSLNSIPQPTAGRAYISNISFHCRKKGGFEILHFDVEFSLNKTICWRNGQFMSKRSHFSSD